MSAPPHHYLYFKLLLSTGQKILASCYAKSGYMRQKVKFGDAHGRGGNLSSSASSTSYHSCTSSSAAFLIDTPAIRIVPNPFHVNVRPLSNRHSSGGQHFTQFRHIPNYGSAQGSACVKINAPQIQETPPFA